MDQSAYILIEDIIARRQKNSASKIKRNVINGERHLKNNGYIHKVNINEIIIKAPAFVDSLFLYFSQPNKTPPNTIPIKIKENSHKKYINPSDTAHLGNIKNNVTLSALPPISQLISPSTSVTPPVIKEGFKLKSLIS